MDRTGREVWQRKSGRGYSNASCWLGQAEPISSPVTFATAVCQTKGLSRLELLVLPGNGTMRLVGGDWGTKEESFSMCDYSLQHVKSRSAKVGETLRTRRFNSGTIGFAAPEDANTAVCVLPGTELAFASAVRSNRLSWLTWKVMALPHTTAILRQVNKDNPHTHHDALEFPDGKVVLLTDL